ncbi:MAG: DUF4416 family protein [Candidatus Ratteibacteria bacterium]
MGIIKIPEPVKVFCAITFSKEEKLNLSLNFLEDLFGKPDIRSEIFPFDFTDYYSEEMGENLKKIFVSFEKKISLENYAQWKIQTNEIEQKLSTSKEKPSRTVNIDPGYVELSKAVLLTTKNFSHRIYIGKGIYAEVSLIWRSGRFNELAWTYPDYKTELAQKFFTRIRQTMVSRSTK